MAAHSHRDPDGGISTFVDSRGAGRRESREFFYAALRSMSKGDDEDDTFSAATDVETVTEACMFSVAVLASVLQASNMPVEDFIEAVEMVSKDHGE